MATKLYLNSASATGAVPNAKQSADTINRDVASSYATYAVPAKMTITAGGNNRLNETTAAEPGSAHYTHYGTWVSDQLAAQTVSGTVTIALSLNEGDSLANANPRVKIYKWLANDTFGSDLLALTTSGTEAPSTYTLTTFFSGTAITSTTFAAGDRIVIEVETYDNNTRTSSYLHGIQFDGADAGVYGSYVSFSADITFPTAYTKTVTTSEVGVRTLIKRVKKIVTTSEVGVRNLAYVHGLIQRKLNAGSFTDLVKVVFGSNAYADSYNLSGGNTYYYRLAKYINGVSQGWSNEVSVSYTSGGANYKTITGTVVGVRANIKRVGKIITKSEVAARTLIRKVGKIVTVPEVAARTLIRKVGKIVTVPEVAARTLLKRLWKPITKSEVGSANLIKQGRKVLSKAVTSYSSLTKIFKWVKTVTQIVVGLRSLRRRIGKPITQLETGAVSIRRRINKIVSKSSAFIATLISIKGLIYKMISTTSVGVRALVKRTGKIITKSEVATASLRRIVGKIVIATAVAQRSITKRILKPLSKVSSFVATLRRRIGKPIIKAEVGYTSLRRTIRKIISKVSSFVAVLEKAALGIIYKTITVSTNMSLSLRRAIRKTISKVPSFVAVLNKGFFKPLLKSEVANASLRRTIRKPIIKALAFSRSLVKGYIYSKILTPSKPELITNGDFETGNMTGWTYLNFGISAGGGFGTYSCLSNDDNAYLYQNLDTSQGLNISWYQKYTVTSGGSLTLSVDSAQIGTYPLLSNSMTLYKVIIDPLAGTHSIKWTFTQGATDWVAIDNISAKRPAFIPSVRRRTGKPIIQFETGVTSLRRRINKIVSKVSAFVSILISQKLAGLIFKTISIAGVGVRSLIKRTGKPIIKTESAVVTLIKRTGKNVVWLEVGVAVLRRRIGKPIIKLEVGYTSLRRTIRKIISKVSSFVAVLEKAALGIIYKTIAVSTTMGLSIRRRTTKLLSKTSTFISIINKRVLKIITKSETAISILRRRIGKPIIKAETGIVSLRRKIGKLLAKVSTFVATLGLSGYVAIYYKTLTTVMASQVSLRRRISKTLSKIVSSVVRMWHDYFPGGWVDDTKRVTLHCKFSPQADVICKWDSTVTVGCNFEIPSITLRCWMDRGV